MALLNAALGVDRNFAAKSWYCKIQLSAYLGKLVYEGLGFKVLSLGVAVGLRAGCILAFRFNLKQEI